MKKVLIAVFLAVLAISCGGPGLKRGQLIFS
jgi:hypothetical protein